MNRLRQLFARAALLCGLFAVSSGFANQDSDAFEAHKTEPTPFVEGSWTVVVIPDTQNYLVAKKRAKNTVHILEGMMDWIVAEREKRNIQVVVHVGDMTNGDNEREWTMIRSVYKKLDNVVPYVVCEGNHDRKHGNLMNDYFKIDDNPLNKETLGGCYEGGKLQNAYYLMEQNKMKYLFLALGENPDDRRKNLAWGNQVIKSHPEHRVFLTYHVYMSEASRLLSKDGLPDPTGNEAYSRLVMSNPNVEFVTCGHFGSHRKGTGKA